ncbi:MAG: FliM/FliN family flagellar motor switch protein [Deltaproteobacteria bacterium]|nr:FliM/FliN family flagellar motor switch protein [Deltaproteobacteria bacterium]
MTLLTEITPSDVETDFTGRPWASRQMARARAAWPHGPMTVPCAGLGELRLSVSALAPVESQTTAGVGTCESFALWRGGRHGRLDVDARFAVAVAGHLLGTPSNLPMSRMLSPGERGAIGALVAVVLDHAGAPLAVAVDPPDAVPLRLDLQVELDLIYSPQGPTPGSPHAGWARLFLPWSWFDTGATLWSNLSRVPFPVAVELARTQIDRASFATLEPGDALVFDGIAMPTAWPREARLVVGAFAAPASLEPSVLRLTGPFAPVDVTIEPHTTLTTAVPAWKAGSSMSSTVEMSSVGSAPAQDAPSASLAQALATTPVEVVAEIGRLVLTGAELAGLEQGEVFTLGTAAKGTITLSVAGRPVAKGALVNVDGTFGVRVTERY